MVVTGLHSEFMKDLEKLSVIRYSTTYWVMSVESQNCEDSREPLAGNGSANMPVIR
jgi:hypothetical protein